MCSYFEYYIKVNGKVQILSEAFVVTKFNEVLLGYQPHQLHI
jgi:hypothetical protein